MFVAVSSSSTTCLKFHGVSTTEPWPRQRPSRLRISFPMSTTRCFLDNIDEAQRLNNSHGIFALTLTTDRYGSNSGALRTIERPKMDMSQKESTSRGIEAEIGGGDREDGGDGGGIGGGTGGGGGFGDKDDYIFDDGGGENGDKDEGFGLFRRRRLVGESFDRISLEAVMSEWMRTMADLPLGLRRACEMGILSSAEIARFFAFDARPTVARLLARLLPRGPALDLTGKLMADRGLLWKLAFEASCSAAWSVWLDLDDQKDLPRKDHMAMSRLVSRAATNAALNAFLATRLAPSSNLANSRNLPNNVFEKSPRFREFGPGERLVSFLRAAGSLFALGFSVELASQAPAIVRNPNKKGLTGAMSAGLSLGLLTNLRYQVICGADTALDLYFDSTKASMTLGAALRCLNVRVGIVRSRNLIGYEDLKEVNCNSHDLVNSSNWLDFKNDIVTGFGLVDHTSKTKSQSNTRRKRVIRKKVRANLC